MEWGIILYLLIYILGALVINLKILFYYSSPDDSKYNHELVAKVISLISLELAWLIISVTPTDAYNARNDAGLKISVFWELALTLNLCLILFPIPFAMAYYEADTDTRLARSPRWCRALKPSCIVLVIGVVTTVVLYFVLRSTKHNVCLPIAPVTNVVSGVSSDTIISSSAVCQLEPTRTPVFLFPGIIFAFLGWLIVFLYLGVGLVMVPAGLILDFVNRSKPMTQEEYRNAKIRLGEEVAALKAIGEELRERDNKVKSLPQGFTKIKEGRLYKSEFNKFCQTVHLLEEEHEKLNVSLHERGENPLLSYAKLVLGIMSIILSALWIAHIITHIIIFQFLSQKRLAGLFDSFMLFVAKARSYVLELAVYIVLMGYLLGCVMVGCFRFNMRAFCFTTIHPMKAGKTHLNSILFNTSVVIVAASALTEFAQTALPEYTAHTLSEKLYTEYLQNTPLLGFFFKYRVFIWLMMLFVIISLIFVAIKPNESKAFNLARLQALRAKMQDKQGDQQSKVRGFETDVENAFGKVQNSANVLGKLAF